MVERFMEFVGGNISIPTGAGALVKATLPIPSSKTEMFAFILHRIDITMAPPMFQSKAENYYDRAFGIFKSDVASVVGFDDASTIWRVDSFHNFIETALSNMSQISESWQLETQFNPPILIAQDLLYIVAQNGSPVNEARVLRFRLGYTLEKVSREAFIASLVS